MQRFQVTQASQPAWAQRITHVAMGWISVKHASEGPYSTPLDKCVGVLGLVGSPKITCGRSLRLNTVVLPSSYCTVVL